MWTYYILYTIYYVLYIILYTIYYIVYYILYTIYFCPGLFILWPVLVPKHICLSYLDTAFDRVQKQTWIETWEKYVNFAFNPLMEYGWFYLW